MRPCRSFYQHDPVPLARALLGQRLVRVLNHHRLAGTIVEVEAYLGIRDKAAHTCNGRRTPRNESMWGEGGHAYVYFTYGMHHCLNVVASTAGDPVAVLIRALEPTEGIEHMYRHRKPARRDSDLCSGPAKLCQALKIDRELDGEDLVKSGGLFIEQVRRSPLPASRVATGPRIGVSYADEWADKPLRFFIKDNIHVSKPRMPPGVPPPPTPRCPGPPPPRPHPPTGGRPADPRTHHRYPLDPTPLAAHRHHGRTVRVATADARRAGS